MNLFKVNVRAKNPRDDRMSPPMEALVDTGSELTWLPKVLLDGIGILPQRKLTFATATKELVQRDVGYAILSAEGFETVDQIVFGEPSDMTLLGVRTLEGFGVAVDNIGHRFIVTPTIVATTMSVASLP